MATIHESPPIQFVCREFERLSRKNDAGILDVVIGEPVEVVLKRVDGIHSQKRFDSGGL